MTKTQLLNIIKDCAKDKDLTKTEKFQVFCNVCDNALHAGQITQTQHTRWTNVF